MTYRIHHGSIQPSNHSQPKSRINRKPHNQRNFQSILEEQIKTQNSSIKVSGHAHRRLAERSIHLSNQDLQRLNEAMEEIDKKGGRESLMLYKNTAFIANIRNRTLITAMDPQNSNEKIFTNIDSAIIVD